MKAAFFFSISFTVFTAKAQEIPQRVQTVWEQQAEQRDGEENMEDWSARLSWRKKHRLNLNRANEEDLQQLPGITPAMIRYFFLYKKQAGALADIWELQAIPGWDSTAIKPLLPFITVAPVQPFMPSLKKSFSGGEHEFLTRATLSSRSYEQYASPMQLLIRHRYVQDKMQWGLLVEKDAGENMRKGFDFYSFHISIQQTGKLDRLLIGDFTVNMGQGLIQWQQFSTGKTADAQWLEKQGIILAPHRSSGEFRFFRGLGASLKTGQWQWTAFASYRKLDASLTDSSRQLMRLQTSGLHRTNTEQKAKAVLPLYSAGMQARWSHALGYLDFNWIHHRTQHSLAPAKAVYSQFDEEGKQWFNASISYSFTWKGVHCYGEAAMDQRKQWAFAGGLQWSPHSMVDLSFFHRRLPVAYRSFFTDVVNERSTVNNEQGTLVGLTFKPSRKWQLNAYADLFHFPWLQYRVDRPSSGVDTRLLCTYQVSKFSSIQLSWHSREKPMNDEGINFTRLSAVNRTGWRLQFEQEWTNGYGIKSRVEAVQWSQGKQKESGWVWMMEGRCRWKHWQFKARCQQLATEGYNSRIYFYEPDVLYASSVPAIYGRGFRYLILISKKITSLMRLDLRWSETVPSSYRLGTNGDDYRINRKEIRVQVLMSF